MLQVKVIGLCVAFIHFICREVCSKIILWISSRCVDFFGIFKKQKRFCHWKCECWIKKNNNENEKENLNNKLLTRIWWQQKNECFNKFNKSISSQFSLLFYIYIVNRILCKDTDDYDEHENEFSSSYGCSFMIQLINI